MTQTFEPANAIVSTNPFTDSNSQEVDAANDSANETNDAAASLGFAQFNLNSHLNDSIVKLQYTTPTPIQLRAIPVIMQGRDVLGIAQTGTGKTAAFALPILNKIMNGKFKGLQALIVVPTRELAHQVCTAISQLAGKSSVRAVMIFGGQSFGMQVKALRNDPDIIVACPGRLLDHVKRKTIRLDSVSMLVLDEADQMFDMGFLPAVREIIRLVPKQRQSMLFSATMPSEIKSLTAEVLTNPETVQVAPILSAATITHKLYGVTQAQKTDMALKLVQEAQTDSVLIFARTKQRTKRLMESLYKSGIGATSLQGNLSQQQRDKSMKGFRAGKYKVMVATDIASRGIDVASIGLVVNFDMPLTTETYLHRVGRTGRALREGIAVTLASPEDRSMVRLLERRLKIGFEHASMEGFDRVDLSGGNADSVQNPQYGRRSGGNRDFRGGGDRGGDRGGRSGGGRFNSRGPRSDGPRSDGPREDRPRSFARRDDAPAAPAFGDAPRAESAPAAFAPRSSYGSERAPRSDNRGFGERSSSRDSNGGGYRGRQGGGGGGYGSRSSGPSSFGGDRGGDRGGYRGQRSDSRFGGGSDNRGGGYAPRGDDRGPNGNRAGAANATSTGFSSERPRYSDRSDRPAYGAGRGGEGRSSGGYGGGGQSRYGDRGASTGGSRFGDRNGGSRGGGYRGERSGGGFRPDRGAPAARSDRPFSGPPAE